MKITPIDNSNGILLLKQGSVLRQIDTFNLVCAYNISYLYTTTLKLSSLYASTKFYDDKIIPGELHKSYTDQIEYKIQMIQSKIIAIIPHSRVRRGIFNGLGSLVKTVTGNLDYDDAVKIEQQISNLNNKIHSIQEKSIVIAQKTIAEFANQLDKINQNQNRLSLIIQNITQHSNIVFRQFSLLQVHIQIDFSLQLILDKLMILEDAMAFAQIGIMHPSVINTKNLIIEMLDMKRKYSFNPVAPIYLENIHEIEKSIEVKAYSTEQSLNFILEIPSVETATYDLIHMYSIPNKDNLTIIPKSKYLVLGKGEYTYIDEDCRSITEDVHICKQLLLKSLQDAGDCITATIEHKINHESCPYAKMMIKKGKLQNISPSSWLLITNTQEVLKATCGTEITYHTLNGVHLIAIPNECYVQVLNKTLQTHSNTVTIEDIIPLPKQEAIRTDEIQAKIQLEDISLDNIHELIKTAHYIQDDVDNNETFISLKPSWTTIALYLLGLGYLSWKLITYITTRRKKMAADQIARPSPQKNSETRFYLKEGGVTMA